MVITAETYAPNDPANTNAAFRPVKVVQLLRSERWNDRR
jgi:hypothetical protein